MHRSKDTLKEDKPTIPARIVVGVTGHRELENEALLAKQVQLILEKIKQLLPPLKNTPLTFSILSPLAEGADRLVAWEVLKIPGSQLEAILPLEKNDYQKDFELPESKSEFGELLSQAHRIKILSSGGRRTEAYAQAGRYIVDQCDILIALWNGKHAAGQGGTAEIIRYAREEKCPLYWINTDNGAKITYEPGKDFVSKPFQELDEYNSEVVDIRKIKQKTQDQYRLFLNQAQKAHFSIPNFHTICEKILPHYGRMDILALRYQNLYFKAGSLIYALAAAAVAVAAFQALFLPDWPRIILIEVAFIVAVFIIYWLGRRHRWHSKWIDYRFLAERFRSALFIATTNIDVATMRPPRHLSLSYSSQDWMVDAFSSFWNLFPRLQVPDSSGFEALRKFLLTAWIDDQIRYYKNTSHRHWRKHRQMSLGGNILFGCTFIAAVLHVLQVGSDLFHHLFAFMAIIFPAIGGALGAIRIHREYQRNAERSTEMVRHLEETKGKMKEAQNLEDFLPLVREAEETMLHENEDWRVVVRFHELETPV